MVYTFLHHSDARMYQMSQQTRHTEKIVYQNFQLLEHIYTYTERRNFKTFRKENYTIGLSSCYLLNFEHGTEHDIDSAYGFWMH